MPFRLRIRAIVALASALGLIAVGLGFQAVHSQDKAGNNAEVENANAVLQAVGGLGVGHIQSTLGLIGVTADAYAKDVYTAKQVEDLMNGTTKGIDHVKGLLRRLQEANLTDDDKEYVDRMITVYNALHREARALMAYAKSKRPADAEAFDTARKAVVFKLGQLTEGVRPTATDSTDAAKE